MNRAYASLEHNFARYFHLKGAASILHWDSATQLAPAAAGIRGEQLGALSEACRDILADPHIGTWLDEVQTQAGTLDAWQAANLREMRHRWRHETAVPADLASAFAREACESEMVWRGAREHDDFALFAPRLEHILALVRDIADAKAGVLGTTPYDALLDQFDPGLRGARIDPLFADLSEFLPDFTQSALEAQKAKPAPKPLHGPFPVEAQRKLARTMMERLGFDFTHGRIDESSHPFCGGVPGDVRLTTHYHENDFLKGFMGVLHETGHALYEMGLPKDWRTQPVGEARGMSLHESQSLLVEMQLCRSPDFLRFAAPLVREAFAVSGPAWEPENLYALVTRVKPGFIRIHADEVTYPSHILLRYRLEKALLSGDLKVRDLPGAWRESMQALLHLTPPTDREGCLQDIHWPEGMFGYFPTYTLGAMTAAQLFAAARQALPALSGQVSRGEFAPLVAWLGAHIHQYGSCFSADELLTKATGLPLDAAAYRRHLHARYLPNQAS